MSDNKSINPICWVPTVYFAMGLPFVALSMVSVLMFSDMGGSENRRAFVFYYDLFEGDDDRDCDRRHRALLSEEPAGRSVHGRDEDDGL